MRERTEEEIFSKSPITVTLGETKYPLKPLPINKARKWRAKVTETMQGIVSILGAQESSESISSSLTAALVAFPDKVAELVFAWESDLPTEKILNEATEEQLGEAFKNIMVFAYPYLAHLAMTVQVTKNQLN